MVVARATPVGWNPASGPQFNLLGVLTCWTLTPRCLTILAEVVAKRQRGTLANLGLPCQLVCAVDQPVAHSQLAKEGPAEPVTMT